MLTTLRYIDGDLEEDEGVGGFSLDEDELVADSLDEDLPCSFAEQVEEEREEPEEISKSTVFFPLRSLSRDWRSCCVTGFALVTLQEGLAFVSGDRTEVV